MSNSEPIAEKIAAADSIQLVAEVISVGDELTTGVRLDTNSQWLSRQLGYFGIQTIQHTTISDSLPLMREAFRSASRRADIIVCSGGLGPTLDDLTRQAIAEAFDAPLELDEASLEHIRGLFQKRGREMPQRNEIQAFFPSGSRVIPNPHGSAPGIDFTFQSPERTSRLLAFPGVPAEMKEMWAQYVVPELDTLVGQQDGPIHFHEIKVFGIGESDVETRLPTLIDRNRFPIVGITVSRATITLRIAARAKDAESFQALIEPTTREIHAALGELIFGYENQELEHVVHDLLKKQGKTVACVEVGAASWVSDWLASVDSDCDTVYQGGLTFPTATHAARWLKKDGQADASNATSNAGKSASDLEGSDQQFWESGGALKLARESARHFAADYGITVATYPRKEAMAVPGASFDFYLAVVGPDTEVAIHRRFGGHPDVLLARLGKTGLDLLRRTLLKLPVGA